MSRHEADQLEALVSRVKGNRNFIAELWLRRPGPMADFNMLIGVAESWAKDLRKPSTPAPPSES